MIAADPGPSDAGSGAPAPAPSPAEAFGRYLARERELRGIALDHVAEVTRISLDRLRALEDGQIQRIPGRVFVVGYIRAYARCVGLSPDEAVLRFEEGQAATGANAAARPPAARGRRRAVISAAAALIALAAGIAAWLAR